MALCGTNLPACFNKIDGETFNHSNIMFNFNTIDDFIINIKNFVIIIKYISSYVIINCNNNDEFNNLLNKMETAYSVFIYKQECLCQN
jgi:hypothetical protein